MSAYIGAFCLLDFKDVFNIMKKHTFERPEKAQNSKAFFRATGETCGSFYSSHHSSKF
jgi:hypothetical protein